MKLSHLGFIIIILILIIIAISVSLFKNKEGFSMDGKIQEQKTTYSDRIIILIIDCFLKW